VIHCQYVYGIGHFVRTIELAKGLCNYFSVSILNGGESVPNFDIPSEINLIPLPAIYKQENVSYLSPVDSTYSIEECFKKRRDIIENSLTNLKPEIIITEHFPFGLLFEDEVVQLISSAKSLNSNVKVVCSVRDIIESASGNIKDNITVKLLNKWYDLLLIHGDEKYFHLKNTFSRYNEISIPNYHTGYIVKRIEQKVKTDNLKPIILASIAGGRLGKELLNVLIKNHSAVNKKTTHKLILFTGAFASSFEELTDEIKKLSYNDIELFAFDRESYLGYFSQADLVISLGGYNSIIESISNQKRLLVYQREFTQGNEEQDLRINLFKEMGVLNVISSKDLNNCNLADSIIQSLNNNIDRNINLNVNGVAFSTELILKLYKSL
jgi:predicted glycosyltransferase